MASVKHSGQKNHKENKQYHLCCQGCILGAAHHLPLPAPHAHGLPPPHPPPPTPPPETHTPPHTLARAMATASSGLPTDSSSCRAASRKYCSTPGSTACTASTARSPATCTHTQEGRIGSGGEGRPLLVLPRQHSAQRGPTGTSHSPGWQAGGCTLPRPPAARPPAHTSPPPARLPSHPPEPSLPAAARPRAQTSGRP